MEKAFFKGDGFHILKITDTIYPKSDILQGLLIIRIFESKF